MPTNRVENIIEKLKKLSPERISEVGNLVDFLSQQNGAEKSVSQVLANHPTFPQKTSLLETGLTPIVRSLKGSLDNAKVSETDYRQYLEEKFL